MSVTSIQLKRIWNTMLNAGDKVFAREKMLARPLRIHIEVNDLCNLKCPHCPRENPNIPKNTGHLPLEAFQRLEPYFRSASYVGLTGNGEPFLHPHIMDILRLVVNAGATPSVISNATLWKKLGIVDEIAGLGPMLLNISVDGGTRETFEKWRLRANYDEVRANLLELHEAKKAKGSPFPVMTFNVCLMKDNIDEVEEIVEWAAECGAVVVNFQNMYPYVDGLDDQRVTDMDYCRRAIAKAGKRARELGVRIDWLPMSVDIDERDDTEGGSYGDLTAAEIERRLADEKREKHDRNGSKVSYHCDNVWNQVHITVAGDVKYCCFWQEGSVGKVMQDDLADLWNGPEWRQLRRDLAAGKKPMSCNNCHNLVRRDSGRMLRASKRELKDLLKR